MWVKSKYSGMAHEWETLQGWVDCSDSELTVANHLWCT